jgi:uncharacterized protein (TIGR03067 family)
LLLVLGTFFIIGADDPGDEAGKLQGTWAVVSADGIDAPEEALKRLKVIIRREFFHIMEGDRAIEKATFKVDPSQKPKAIDLTKDPNRPIARGIYELDRDTLRLVWRKGGPRPTEILTKRRPQQFTEGPAEDADLIMMVLKREQQP